LGRLLAEAADLYHTEVLPGEMRTWSLCFQGELPEMLEKAFVEHFKTAKFMPRPGDVTAIIYRIRGEQSTYWRMVPSRAETDAHQATPEWAKASLEARGAFAKAAGRPEPKA